MNDALKKAAIPALILELLTYIVCNISGFDVNELVRCIIVFGNPIFVFIVIFVVLAYRNLLTEIKELKESLNAITEKNKENIE